MSDSAGGMVNIMTLAPQELHQLRQTMTNEIETLTANFQNLKLACSRFGHALEAVSEMATAPEGKEALIPLTSAMYVPAKLAETNKILVELGTGYFVEKQTKDAAKFLENRVTFLTSQTKKLSEIIMEKKQQLDKVTEVLSAKIQAAQLSQKANLDKLAQQE